MEAFDRKSVQLAAGLGAIAGMRATIAPAILSHYVSRKSTSGLSNSQLEFVRTSLFDKAAKFLAAGELVGDKLPQTADRTTAGGLVGRVLSGALVGAAVFKHNNNKLWKGALVGGASAIVSAFLFFYVRKKIGDKAHIQDKLLGAIEDAVAISSGVAVMKKAIA